MDAEVSRAENHQSKREAIPFVHVAFTALYPVLDKEKIPWAKVAFSLYPPFLVLCDYKCIFSFTFSHSQQDGEASRLRKSWILPQDLVTHVWEWGCDWKFALLGYLFGINIETYTDSFARSTYTSHIGEVYDSYWKSPHPINERNMICNHLAPVDGKGKTTHELLDYFGSFVTPAPALMLSQALANKRYKWVWLIFYLWISNCSQCQKKNTNLTKQFNNQRPQDTCKYGACRTWAPFDFFTSIDKKLLFSNTTDREHSNNERRSHQPKSLLDTRQLWLWGKARGKTFDAAVWSEWGRAWWKMRFRVFFETAEGWKFSLVFQFFRVVCFVL